MAQIEANSTKDIEVARRAFVKWWRENEEAIPLEGQAICNSISWGLFSLANIDAPPVLKSKLLADVDRLEALINRESRP